MKRRRAQRIEPARLHPAIPAIIGLLLLAYLYEITKTSVLGYHASDLIKNRDELAAQRQDLIVQAAQKQSLDMTRTATKGRMVPITNAVYTKNSPVD